MSDKVFVVIGTILFIALYVIGKIMDHIYEEDGSDRNAVACAIAYGISICYDLTFVGVLLFHYI